MRAWGANTMDKSAKRGTKEQPAIEPKAFNRHQQSRRRPLRLKIDLERLVSDSGYREEIRRQLEDRSD